MAINSIQTDQMKFKKKKNGRIVLFLIILIEYCVIIGNIRCWYTINAYDHDNNVKETD